MNESRVGEYVSRIHEVKDALEADGWVRAREDEWRKEGRSVRFNYAHGEFRILVRRRPEVMEELHSIFVREASDAHVPTVREIIEDVLELGAMARNTK